MERNLTLKRMVFQKEQRVSNCLCRKQNETKT